MEFLILFVVVGLIWHFLRRSPTAPAESAPPPTAAPAPTKQAREAAHQQHALAFVNAKAAERKSANQAQRRWDQRFAKTTLEDIDGMSGVAFEGFLAGVLRERGFDVQTTPTSGDFGADLILNRAGERTAVQAKRWRDAVGVAAVQEVNAARDYYRCTHAWVVTCARYTPAARDLAAKANVTLVDRATLARWIAEREQTKPPTA